MNERKHFIAAHQRGELGVAELCRRFGISRKTGYKWLERFYADGADDEEALRDRSRRPHSHPRAVPSWLEDAIADARRQRPHWGPKKLRAVLVHRNPGVELPALSTFAKIFRRQGLVRPRRRSRSTPPSAAPFGSITAPNALWCVDFKGHFAVGRVRCHPLTVMDAHSRYWIACLALRRPDAIHVRHAPSSESSTSSACPRRSAATMARPSLRLRQAAYPGSRPGGASSASATSGSHPASRTRTGGTSACIARSSRRRRCRPPRAFPPSSAPSIAFAATTTTSDHMRRSGSRRRPPATSRPDVLCPYRAGGGTSYAGDFETVRTDKHDVARWHGHSLLISSALQHELLGLEPTAPDTWQVYFGTLPLGRIERPGAGRFRLRFQRASDPQRDRGALPPGPPV